MPSPAPRSRTARRTTAGVTPATPAISVAHQAAQAFAVWLSRKTGKNYRLPTEAEWAHAAALAAGKDAVTPARLDALAWHRGNASARTHPVATKSADALGLFDLFGNAAEWVTADRRRHGARHARRIVPRCTRRRSDLARARSRTKPGTSAIRSFPRADGGSLMDRSWGSGWWRRDDRQKESLKSDVGSLKWRSGNSEV